LQEWYQLSRSPIIIYIYNIFARRFISCWAFFLTVSPDLELRMDSSFPTQGSRSSSRGSHSGARQDRLNLGDRTAASGSPSRYRNNNLLFYFARLFCCCFYLYLLFVLAHSKSWTWKGSISICNNNTSKNIPKNTRQSIHQLLKKNFKTCRNTNMSNKSLTPQKKEKKKHDIFHTYFYYVCGKR